MKWNYTRISGREKGEKQLSLKDRQDTWVSQFHWIDAESSFADAISLGYEINDRNDHLIVHTLYDQWSLAKKLGR